MDVSLPQGTTYILVVDTDAYAGNFERQLAGYATGVVDVDRHHGIEEAAQAEEAAPEMVRALRAKSLAVSHHDYGMVTNTIRATPGRLNNGSGFHYTPGGPEVEEDARARAKKSMTDYYATAHAHVRRRLEEGDFQPDGPGAWTKAACERTLADAQASIDRAGQFIAYPAYESVAMFFSEPLTDAEMTFVRERAEEFSKTSSLLWKSFRALDVRLVEATSGTTEKPFG